MHSNKKYTKKKGYLVMRIKNKPKLVSSYLLTKSEASHFQKKKPKNKVKVKAQGCSHNTQGKCLQIHHCKF